MEEHIDYENIFTPQGMLGQVSKKPNLDFLMNIFNIPRVYSVSGFGTWNVGQHTMAVAAKPALSNTWPGSSASP